MFFTDTNVQKWKLNMAIPWCENFSKHCSLHGEITPEIKEKYGHTHVHCSFAEVTMSHLTSSKGPGLFICTEDHKSLIRATPSHSTIPVGPPEPPRAVATNSSPKPPHPPTSAPTQ